eukprot:1997744-Amphidinium_carterae.1
MGSLATLWFEFHALPFRLKPPCGVSNSFWVFINYGMGPQRVRELMVGLSALMGLQKGKPGRWGANTFAQQN